MAHIFSITRGKWQTRLFAVAAFATIALTFCSVVATIQALWAIGMVGAAMNVEKAITPYVIELAGDAIMDACYAVFLSLLMRVSLAAVKALEE